MRYLSLVADYLSENGWRTDRHSLKPDVDLFLAAKKISQNEPRRGLFIVFTDREYTVSTLDVKSFFKLCYDHSVDVAGLAAHGSIETGARNLLNEHGVEIISNSTLSKLHDSESSEFADEMEWVTISGGEELDADQEPAPTDSSDDDTSDETANLWK